MSKEEHFLEAVKLFGTPIYVYEGESIVRQIERLRAAFSGFDHRILYAAKALANQSILRLIQQNSCGLDAVSLSEIQLGLLAGFEPSNILFTPSNPDFSEIEAAVELGVHINLESLSSISKFGEKYGSSYPVFIRINPHILAGGNPKIQTGHIDSKFGISIFKLDEIKGLTNRLGIRIEGLHVHTGSEFLEPSVFLQGAHLLFQAADLFPDLEYIDFGSGFKVANREGEIETPVESLGAQFSEVVEKFNQTRSKPVQVWFEPGKYLVMQSGTLLTKVTTVKPSPTSVFVGVDTGLNHLIRPMMYDSYHPIDNISAKDKPKHVYTIVGNICETDTLGYNRQMSETTEGDILAIRNAGAYGFSMASQYNGRFRPPEALIYQGKIHLIRQREMLEDLLQNQINPGIFEDSDLGLNK